MARPTLPNLTILLLCGLAELWCRCEAQQMLHSCQGGNGLACPAESHSVLQTKVSELTELDSEGDTLGEDLEKVSGMTQTNSEADDLDEDGEQVAEMNQVDSEADDLDEDGEEVSEMNQVDSEAGDLDEDGEEVSEMNQADSEADDLDEEGEEVSEMTQVDSEADTLAGGVKHSGRGCWRGCKRKQGPCTWCGTGSCCRYGWHDKSNGCDGTFGIPRSGHVCVSTAACSSFASSKACPDSRCIWSSGACQAPGALSVKNYGKGCWRGCTRKQGPCNWCGTGGSCCRFGWRDKRNGCDGTLGIPRMGHVCTANPSMNQIPTTTTSTTTTTTSTTPSTTTSTAPSPTPTPTPTPTPAPVPTNPTPASTPHPGGFCGSRLYSDLPDSTTCEDGTKVSSNGCCAATNKCPQSCSGNGWSMSRGVKSCQCRGCPYSLKLNVTSEERYLRATNYFRCRHGQPLMKWDAMVASNAKSWASTCPSQRRPSGKLNPPHTRPDGTNSYKVTPMSGENVAAGSTSPEKAVELWYNEITKPGYKPGVRPGYQSGTGHYTAMMWAQSKYLGCAQKPCLNGNPKHVHVCHYALSAPNSGEDQDYWDNLPKTNTPSASEETCCQTMYGDSGGAANSNPYLNPVAPTTTPAPIATQGPCLGVFNEGTRFLQMKPWHINNVWVYGASSGGWSKMVSVDKNGEKIESRHSKTLITNSMSTKKLQAVWDAANRGGGYTVEVVLGDTSVPAPAVKPYPGAGDAEGTVYNSNGDEGGRRSSVRRRMRGKYYSIPQQANYLLIKSGAQCRSTNKYYGCWLRTAGDCARKMKKEGKKFFSFWAYRGKFPPKWMGGKCYGEKTRSASFKTPSASCPEGFRSGKSDSKYSFYAVLN